MTTIGFRRYSPDTCDCALELEISDQDVETLCFFHNICTAHKPLAQAAPQLTAAQTQQKQIDITNLLETLLSNNRTKNLNDYDNSPVIKNRVIAAANMMLISATEQQGLLLQAQANAERDMILKGLGDHEARARSKILPSIFANTLAFSGATVFAAIKEENDRKNIAYQIALENGPSTFYDIKDGNRVLKETIFFTFTWSGNAPNRVLSISYSQALTNAQKNTIKSALNAKFGSGKVNVL